MLYTIRNEHLQVTVSDHGAELTSLRGARSGEEYLWQGDPSLWDRQAPILFPICGRLTGGKYTCHHGTFSFPIHGFAKDSRFTPLREEPELLTLELTDSAETRRCYPFSFRLRVTFALHGSTLQNRIEVQNTGDEELIFAVGGHPGFRVPFTDGGAFEEHYLEFSAPCTPKKLQLSPTCYYTGERVPFLLESGKRLSLRHDLFDEDAIFLTDASKQVSLRSKKCDRAVTVTYPDMPYIGFWHTPKAAAPFVCIEPWCGLPARDGLIDEFATRESMTHLPAGECYTASFDITITE